MSGDAAVAQTRAHWSDALAGLQACNDHLRAYDVAREALRAFPDDPAFEYAAILALARCGATGLARERLERAQKDGRLQDLADAGLARDFATLGPRLLKDLALDATGAKQRAFARASADGYAAAHHRFRDSYPAINAASMSLLAGDRDAAARLAAVALHAACSESPNYWTLATAAEAELLLGRPQAASDRLRAAASAAPALDQIATTRRQFRLLCDVLGVSADVLDVLPTARVLFWTGITGAMPQQPPFAGALTGAVLACGPLLSRADLELAAMLIDAGAEVRLVLPSSPPAWCAAEAVPPGRLQPVLDRAAATLIVTEDGIPREPAARQLARVQAHGLALLQADAQTTGAEQLGATASGWTLSPAGVDDGHAADEAEAVDTPARLARVPKAMVFGDVQGFSRLGEFAQLDFFDHVIGGFAHTLEACPGVEYVETAGDGIFVVLADVQAAVACAFGLRGVLHAERIAAAGLPSHLAIRLAAHVGPVYRRHDPILGRDRFCGTEIVRTARIEPVTPPGEIFVTEQFAATLACVAYGRYRCEYAGIQSMAKSYGECRMYSLSEVSAARTA